MEHTCTIFALYALHVRHQHLHCSSTMDTLSSHEAGDQAQIRHRWRLDYGDTSHVSVMSQPSRPPQLRTILQSAAIPPAFPPTLSPYQPSALAALSPPTISSRTVDQGSLYKRAWKLAFNPLRTLLTSFFALFMAGTSVNLFSLASITTVMLLHFSALLRIRTHFSPVSSNVQFSLLPHYVVYAVLCALGLAAAVWNALQIGFIPIMWSDWISLLPPINVPPSPYIVAFA